VVQKISSNGNKLTDVISIANLLTVNHTDYITLSILLHYNNCVNSSKVQLAVTHPTSYIAGLVVNTNYGVSVPSFLYMVGI